jgi:hypothetical protein
VQRKDAWKREDRVGTDHPLAEGGGFEPDEERIEHGGVGSVPAEDYPFVTVVTSAFR